MERISNVENHKKFRSLDHPAGGLSGSRTSTSLDAPCWRQKPKNHTYIESNKYVKFRKKKCSILEFKKYMEEELRSPKIQNDRLQFLGGKWNRIRQNIVYRIEKIFTIDDTKFKEHILQGIEKKKKNWNRRIERKKIRNRMKTMGSKSAKIRF